MTSRSRALGAGVTLLLVGVPGCTRVSERPSIVLIVLDTLRADAVSAYGAVEGTTPRLDALARDGLLYEQVSSNANWTLPSHASLLTGRLPSQNGVRGHTDVLRGVPTLAGSLRTAGYETMAITENEWLKPETGLARGFGGFVHATEATPILTALRDWLERRDRERPFLLFVNVMDAHWPYQDRPRNPYVPAQADPARVRGLVEKGVPRLCTLRRGHPDLAVLRGLYLGNVRAADAKLGTILDLLAPVRAERPTIVLVTSDHGEYFGEGGLVFHHVGVGEPVLRVPLVVHGLPGAVPARISAPIQLLDLMPTILDWVGAAAPDGLDGTVLPTVPTAGAHSALRVAEHHDYTPDFLSHFAPEIRQRMAEDRASCGSEDRVFGDMRSAVRSPYKLIWYERYPPQLFDLANDPGERIDLAEREPGRVARMSADLDGPRVSRPAPAEGPDGGLDPAAAERLRALGYLGGSPGEEPP